MAYHQISVDTKISAVKDYFKGFRPVEIEHRYNVDRDSLRIWIHQAESAIREVLTPKPGRPPKPGVAERFPTTPQQSQESVDLELPRSSRSKVSGICPVCKGTHIIKNGSYSTGGKREPRQRIQRFYCRDCGRTLYQSKKKLDEPESAPSLCPGKR